MENIFYSFVCSSTLLSSIGSSFARIVKYTEFSPHTKCSLHTKIIGEILVDTKWNCRSNFLNFFENFGFFLENLKIKLELIKKRPNLWKNAALLKKKLKIFRKLFVF